MPRRQLQPFIYLRSLFGFGVSNNVVRSDPLRQASVSLRELPLFGASAWSTMQDVVQDIADRLQLYAEFEQMGGDDMIAAVLDVYAEDSTQINPENNKVVWPSSKNTKIQEILEKLFTLIDANENAFPIVREIGQMGDSFSLLIRGTYTSGNEAGVVSVRPLKASVVSRCMDELNRLTGFLLSAQQTSVAVEGVEPNVKPWDVVHFRLLGYNRQSEYGRSLLAPARRLWRRLRMMEDALMIYRLKRSPDRFVFGLKGTSGLSPTDRLRVMSKLRDSLRKRTVIDRGSGEMKSEVDPWSLDEDFYIDEEAISINRLQGSAQVNQVLDVDYMRKRLYGALKVPPDYFGFSEGKNGLGNAQSTLADQDIQFARQCKRLQHTYMLGMVRLCKIHLALMGINPELTENEFDINMVPVSFLEEMQRAKVFKIRSATIRELKSIGTDLSVDQDKWLEYIFAASGFPKYVIDKVKKIDGIGMSGQVPVHDRTGRVLSEEDIRIAERLMGDNADLLEELRNDLRSRVRSSDHVLSPDEYKVIIQERENNNGPTVRGSKESTALLTRVSEDAERERPKG